MPRAVEREKWDPKPPNVDIDGGFFFSADTVEELAQKIVMKYQRVPMPPDNLVETVSRYNGFVDLGRDFDFGKPAPRYRSASRRSTPRGRRRSLHDTPRRAAHQRALPGGGHERRR